MKDAFLWLAVFFKKRYLPIITRRCKIRADVVRSEDSLIFRLWDRRKSISYLVKEINGEIYLFRDDECLSPRGWDESGNPLPYTEREVLRAFLALASAVLIESVCLSIRRILVRRKVPAKIYVIPPPPVPALAVEPAGAERKYLIAPHVKDDKILFRILQRDIFSWELKVISSFEIPLKAFRPDEVTRAIGLLWL